MVSLLHKNVWDFSAKMGEPGSYAALQDLTERLISVYTMEGRLEENPFLPTTKRTLSLPQTELENALKYSTCLVTGGLGCVGGALVKRLLSFNISRLVIVDRGNHSVADYLTDARVIVINADICDEERMEDIFQKYQPQYVFHTAAERNPGYAEKHVLETVRTNVLGTIAILNVCERTHSVRQCVFSSTGKASRYYTTEIYAATKKFCEYLFEAYAGKSSKRYSAVRFTHILDNSLMNQELGEVENVDYLAIHSPGKYVTAQNVTEAADLMLNALIYSEQGTCNFLAVRNLEWPVESLEVALYNIKKSKRRIPVIYRGNPPGYCEKFFRGQMDWSDPMELNLLINVYECRNKVTSKDGDIIVSKVCPADREVVDDVCSNIRLVYDEVSARVYLLRELKKLVQSSLTKVDQRDTVKILQWGLQPKFLAAEGTSISDYAELVSLLYQSLESTNFADEVKDLVRSDHNASKPSFFSFYETGPQVSY